MKNISLLSAALFLTFSSFCLAVPDGFFENLTGRKNPFRRQAEIIFPDGSTETVYRKNSIKEIFEKCRARGACKGSGIYRLNVGSQRDVEEGSPATAASLLDSAPYCKRAIMTCPKVVPIVSSKRVVAPIPVPVVEVPKPEIPMTPELKSASQLAGQTGQISQQIQKKPVTFLERYQYVIWFSLAAVVSGSIGYNLIPSEKSGKK